MRTKSFSEWKDSVTSTQQDFYSPTTVAPDMYVGDPTVRDRWKEYIDDTDIDLDKIPNDWSDRIYPSSRKKKVEKEKIYREVDEDSYIVITLEDMKKEVGEITKIFPRIKHWVVVCLNCGRKDLLKEFLSNPFGTAKSFACPNCESKAIGLPEEKEHLLVKEVLKGEGTEENDENDSS